MAPITLCIVGCGKQKLGREARARDLYTGSLFRAARAFAERCDDWRILSAAYGVLRPETRIKPYDKRLTRNALERQQWALVSATSITSTMAPIGYEVIFLASADYADPIAAELERRGVICKQPLRGMGIGKRLQWLTQDVAAHDRGEGTLEAAS